MHIQHVAIFRFFEFHATVLYFLCSCCCYTIAFNLQFFLMGSDRRVLFCHVLMNQMYKRCHMHHPPSQKATDTSCLALSRMLYEASHK